MFTSSFRAFLLVKRNSLLKTATCNTVRGGIVVPSTHTKSTQFNTDHPNHLYSAATLDPEAHSRQHLWSSSSVARGLVAMGVDRIWNNRDIDVPKSKTEPFCCHKLGETRGTEPWTSQGSCDLRNAQFVPFLLENFEGGRKIVNWSALTLSGIHGALLRMSHVFRTSNDQRCGLSFNSSVAWSCVANNILYIYDII